MTCWKRKVLVVCAIVLAATPAAAQQDRAALIDEARVTFGDTTVIRLLHSAMAPSRGGPDSLWATAGYELALALLRIDQPDHAMLWLRTVARHAPAFPIDAVNFPPNVVAAYEQAAQSVAAEADDGAVSTQWGWPAALDADSEGTIEVAAGAAQPDVTVETVGPVQPGGIMSLPPGTYSVTVSADGWEPVRVRREVLPGTALALAVELVPLLPASVEADVASNVVRITHQRAGQPVCRSGYVATTDGLVLTTLDAVRDAGPISVSAFGGSRTFTDVAVVATDARRDLAVLRLPVESTTALAVSDGIAPGDYAWSIQATGCDGDTVNRTRIANWNAAAAATLGVPLPPGAAGSALIDRGGFLIGIVTGPSNALPDALTRDLIERARTLIAVQIRPPAGGGFPWKWVGLGAAVAGVGVAVAGGGGGGGNGGGNPPPPTTGGIIITFPN